MFVSRVCLIITSTLHSYNQAKPGLTSGGSATKLTYSHSKAAVSSKLKALATPLAGASESKASIALAEMRAKVAAEKGGAAAPSVSTASATEAVAATPAQSKLVSMNLVPSASRITSAKTTTPQIKAVLKTTSSSALKSILDPANKAVVQKPVEKPLSPMQTYEMSDREEESDSESDDSDVENDQRPKKAVSVILWFIRCIIVLYSIVLTYSLSYSHLPSGSNMGPTKQSPRSTRKAIRRWSQSSRPRQNLWRSPHLQPRGHF